MWLSKISWTNKSLLLQHLLINSTLLHELPSHNGFFKNFFLLQTLFVHYLFPFFLYLNFISCLMHFCYSCFVWCKQKIKIKIKKTIQKIQKLKKKKKKKFKENFWLGALGSLVTFLTPFNAQLKMVSLRPTISVKVDLFMLILQKLQKCFSSERKKKKKSRKT